MAGNGRISFYYGGGNLFNFDGKDFHTHIKYAAVIDSKKEENNYVNQTELSNQKLISDFLGGYDRIKENCRLYSGIEAKGVDSLCQESSNLTEKPIVVLDVAVFLKNEEKNDRIDVLLITLNQNNCALWRQSIFPTPNYGQRENLKSSKNTAAILRG
jgi:hypothetical protein